MIQTFDTKTLRDLQFERVLEDAASRAQTVVGAQLVRSLCVLQDPGSCTQELAMVEEATYVVQAREAPSLVGVEDIRGLVEEASKDKTLSAPELIACARVFQTGHEVKAFFQAAQLRVPLLAQWVSTWPDLYTVGERIAATFTPDLRIRDDASPILAELRREAEYLSRKVRAKIEDMLKEERVRGFLQDEYFTLRNGRFVLPVKAEEHRFFPGIIQGTSKSGATIYVEPEAIVSDNNHLKWVLDQIEIEEIAVLQERSSLIGRFAAQAQRLAEALFRLDCILARARQALAFNGAFPKVSTKPEVPLDLLEVRNPLLLVLGREVVPINISLKEPPSGLILSGPNAGGKTVALCSVGLCIAMLRFGLLPPLNPSSTIPWYDKVYTLLGDLTDVDQSVSTFTGQMQRISEIMTNAAGRTLALLDEIGTGTEPRYGEALATSIVEALTEQGVECIVATHFEGLKELGRTHPRFANARVCLDPQTGRPTYRIEMGEPGRSNPFEAAREAGLPEVVIERAKRRVDERESRLEELLREVEVLRATLEKEKAEVEILRRQAAEQKKKYEAEVARLRRQADRLVYEARRDVLQKMKSLEAELEAIEKELKHERAKQKVTVVRREVREKKAQVNSEMAKEAPLVEDLPSEPFPADEIRPGAEVFVLPLRAEGRVVGLAADKKRVEIQVGSMRTIVKVEELRKPLKKKGRAHQASGGSSAKQETDAPTTIDLRGLRVQEALAALEKGLDEAYRSGRDVAVTVIHGVGTTALRNAVRQYLEKAPYPLIFRPGDLDEGGDGVTIVTFKG